MQLAPYYIDFTYDEHSLDGLYAPTYKPLKLTGRWKVVIDADGCVIYVEHKHWLFNQWIHEDDIVIRPAPLNVINNCNSRRIP